MKIACPTKDNMVDNHFGHCAYFTIFTLEDNKLIKEETLPSPVGCGCKSNITEDLEKLGVNLMLAGNMGDGALNVLNSHNIQVIRGCQGDIHDVLNAYLEGKLKDSLISCDHHDCDHEH